MKPDVARYESSAGEEALDIIRDRRTAGVGREPVEGLCDKSGNLDAFGVIGATPERIKD